MWRPLPSSAEKESNTCCRMGVGPTEAEKLYTRKKDMKIIENSFLAWQNSRRCWYLSVCMQSLWSWMFDGSYAPWHSAMPSRVQIACLPASTGPDLQWMASREMKCTIAPLELSCELINSTETAAEEELKFAHEPDCCAERNVLVKVVQLCLTST